jgi:nucleoid-associated protein YgaU
MNRETGIENEYEYNQAIKFIDNCDYLINKYYSELSKASTDEDIVKWQDIIDRLKRRRLGWFNLVMLYQKTNNNTDKIQEYFCIKGDTLPMIAYKYYGDHTKWQYIYWYNELTDVNLTPNQSLIIPDIGQDSYPILGAEFIQLIEKDRIERGLD